MLCVATAGQVLALAATTFTLSWTHSVERTSWVERWQIAGDFLQLEAAQVEGPGAGIYLPEDARRTASGWSYRPRLPPLPRLTLAASGATGAGWSLCTDLDCVELGDAPGVPIEIWAAAACAAAAKSP